MKTERARLPLEPERPVSSAECTEFERLLALRERRRPVAQLLGQAEFWSLPFEVSDDVLAPRPETEMLVEAAAAHLSSTPTALAADVGTGSGCIAVALANEVPGARVLATDTSPRALAVAGRNAVANAVADRVTLLRGDLLAPLDPGRPLDAVLSNPPYVRRSEAGEVDPEVLWEPASAVFCEGTPAKLYARIAADAAPLLRAGGILLLETPDRGTDAIVAAVAAAGAYREIVVERDLAGKLRMLRAVRQ